MISFEFHDEDFSAHVERFLLAYFSVLKGEMQRSGYELQAHISSQMSFTAPQGGSFRNSPRLGIERGDLSRALIPNQTGNAFSVTAGSLQQGFDVRYGINATTIPYAAIHEYGGFIRHKGKMPYKLFAMARETGNDFYRIVGASALKKGGINIKARPYFGPGFEQFESKTWPKKLDRISLALSQTWEQTR